MSRSSALPADTFSMRSVYAVNVLWSSLKTKPALRLEVDECIPRPLFATCD
jgi:hypothetical protein